MSELLSEGQPNSLPKPAGWTIIAVAFGRVAQLVRAHVSHT